VTGVGTGALACADERSSPLSRMTCVVPRGLTMWRIPATQDFRPGFLLCRPLRGWS